MLRDNNPLIEEIYERRKENYKDVRSLHTIKAIEKRLGELKKLIDAMPQSKKVYENKQFKRLCLESRLLTTKRVLYKSDAPSLAIVKWDLDLSSKYRWQPRETPEVAESEKRKHTLILLGFMLGSKTDDELRAILAQIQQNM